MAVEVGAINPGELAAKNIELEGRVEEARTRVEADKEARAGEYFEIQTALEVNAQSREDVAKAIAHYEELRRINNDSLNEQDTADLAGLQDLDKQLREATDKMETRTRALYNLPDVADRIAKREAEMVVEAEGEESRTEQQEQLTARAEKIITDAREESKKLGEKLPPLLAEFNRIRLLVIDAEYDKSFNKKELTEPFGAEPPRDGKERNRFYVLMDGVKQAANSHLVLTNPTGVSDFKESLDKMRKELGWFDGKNADVLKHIGDSSQLLRFETIRVAYEKNQKELDSIAEQIDALAQEWSQLVGQAEEVDAEQVALYTGSASQERTPKIAYTVRELAKVATADSAKKYVERGESTGPIGDFLLNLERNPTQMKPIKRD